MVVCLERGADLHMAQLMPLPLTVSCFSKIQIGFTFLVPAHLGSPGKRAVKRVCVVCVCVCVTVCITIVVQSMAVGRRGQNGSRVLSTRLRSQSLTRMMSVAVKHDRVTVRHLVTTDRHAAETPFKSPTALVSTPHTLSVKKTRHQTLAHNFAEC